MPKVGSRRSTTRKTTSTRSKSKSGKIETIGVDLKGGAESSAQQLDSIGELLPGVFCAEYEEEHHPDEVDPVIEVGGFGPRSFETKGIYGRDDRTRVADTELYPFSGICFITSPAGPGQVTIGTGWFVGPRTVVTAGHVVYPRETRRFSSSYEVFVGRNGRPDTSSLRASAVRVETTAAWVNSLSEPDDYAVLILEDAVSDDDILVPLDANTADLERMYVNVAGYPGDKVNLRQNHAPMWVGADRMHHVTNQQLHYLSDTKKGNSGGPVIYVNDSSEAYVVGIHNYAGPSAGPERVHYNTATRITNEVLTTIHGWIEQS